MDRRRSARIVPEIYEATVNPGHWSYVLAMMAKLTRSQYACLFHSYKEMNISSVVAQYGFSASMSVEIDLQLEILNALFDRGSLASSNHALSIYTPDQGPVSDDNAAKYRDWMQANDIHYVYGGHIMDDANARASFALMRNGNNGEWDEGEIRVVREILPHLSRALTIHSEFTHLRIRQDALLKGLDRLVIGLIVYDRHAQVVYINPTARSIIDEHPAFQIYENNIVLANTEEDRKLKNSIMTAASIDPDDSWKQSVAIGVTHAKCESPLPMLVTPMHAHMITSDLDYEGAKVAVFLSDPNVKHPISADSLSSVYGLTPSEAQVSISLVNGHNIEQIAKASNHSTHTIRSQLKSVFRKTGVARQSELIKLLLSGPFAQRRKSNVQ